MKRFILAALVAMAVALSTGCASTGLPPQLTDTMSEACAFYQKARPAISQYREWARVHWNDTITAPDGSVVPIIPHEAKDLLLELDGYLPKLDDAGRLVCLVAEGVLPGNEQAAVSGSVDWDRVLSTTMKVATLALELKAQGAF